MKPGPQIIYQYLLTKEDKTADIDELIENLPKLYLKKEKIERWAKQYSDKFILENDRLFIKDYEDQTVESFEKSSTIKNKKDLAPYVERRTKLLEDLKKLFVGPFEEEEILGKQKPPMSFYLTGKLAPYGSTFEVINEEENDVKTKELLDTEQLDEILSNRNPFRPSTMGFSFRLKKLVPLNVKVSWGMYDDEEHKRTPFNQELTFIPDTKEIMLQPPGVLKCKVRERNGTYHISLFLINNYKRDSYPLQSEIMFQTEITVSFEAEAAATFVSKADKWNYEDELLYRHVKEYAIGHGVGVEYDIDDKICKIKTNWLPSYELPIVEHRVIANLNVKMMDLATQSPNELKENLSIIPNTYKDWLKLQRKQLSDLPEHLMEVAIRNIKDVEKIIERIESGIETITNGKNPLEYKAFQFANKVMAIQQAQSKVALHYRNSNEIIPPKYDGEWRLFQLAFFLMNINGVSNSEHEDRNVVDLLWFPTGGGKTEAYLGISAFLIGLRRLRGLATEPESYAGVTVLMRYTLRLLTTQQFQRATTMICAAEWLRRSDPETWGYEPFRIGLWIGQASTPNKY
jgi:hypothetical protein